jgi:hypothetical protein
MVQEAMRLDAVLPDDPVVLQGMIRELLLRLHERDHELAGVQHRLDLLLKRLYGPKAERFDPNQPTLFDGCPPPPTPEPTTPPNESEAASRPKKKGHGRQKLPAHLERRRKECDLSDAEKLCPCCRQPRLPIGEEVTEVLDYLPSSLFVWQYVRFKYACPACLKKRQTETTAEAPSAATEPMPVGSTLQAWLPTTDNETERAKLIVTAPLPKVPVVPPFPICKLPALIVVVPL